MRSRMIAFCLGIALVSRFPDLPVLHAGWLTAFGMLLVHGLFGRHLLVALSAALVIGMLWAVVFGNARLASMLPDYLEGEDFWVTGTIRGLPQNSGRAHQFTFFVERSCFSLLPTDCPAQSRVFTHRRIMLNFYGTDVMESGQRWLLRVRLNKPRGFANPGGFDYEGWLFQQGFAAKGYIRDNPFNVRLEDAPITLSQLRFAIRERLLEATDGLAQAGIILALVLGDREQISEEGWTLFTDTGTNHLIVISGLHVGFIALLCYLLADRSARISTALMLRVPAQKLGAFAAIAGALAYSLLAGFSVPTQRAFIMVCVFMSGQLLGRQFAPSTSYCLALSLVLVSNPLSLIGAGFWLSFGAVGTLLLAFSGVRRLRAVTEEGAAGGRWSWLQLWRQWGQPQWVVFVGMSVPLAVWMQQISLLGPLANILAIPLVSLLVVPLSLCGAFLLWVHETSGMFLLVLVNELLDLMMWGLRMLTGSGIVLWQFFGLTIASVLAAAAGTVVLLLPRGWPDKWLASILFLPMFFPVRPQLPTGVAEVVLLDVGQGLAMVVRTASHTLVYDTGPRLSESFDTGSAVVYPYLRARGLRFVDRVIVSHGDNDHAGGLGSLLELVEIGEIIGSVVPDLPGAFDLFTPCEAGQRWVWDDVQFEMLYPMPGSPYAGNDSSCVLRIEAGGQSALLSGDIERGAEARLLRGLDGHLENLVDSDVLIAPHHGSRSSSTPAFVAAVSPAVVLYSAGYRSQFGHPSTEVVERYVASGAIAWNTALSGALTLRLGESPKLAPPVQYRQTHRRYWFAPITHESARLHGIAESGRLPSNGE
ncbi:MAG: DNA internalization-related competence protein ComEC/Rec2 [Gammaproteobacteria bacterium]|nr:DNA internalization-related competence protein ComEC/Rec2 [Gammaproteobacteria bacterium]MDP2349050.1 DNA internalization-related competence protein ComEC/Rec2 [Gammaproteobacteria bacterium]